MARRPKNYRTKGLYHMVAKTNNDEFRLVEEDDLLVLEAYISLYKHIHGVSIYGYSNLNNHLHFKIQNSDEDEDAISCFFRDFKREFAKYYNIAYGRKGSFWKSGNSFKEIESETQAVNTLVYILNNPVKARKCEVAWEYAFSSFHLPMTDAALKTLEQTKEFLSVEDAIKLIKKVKKTTTYGCKLPKEEHLARGLAHCAETPYEKRLASVGRRDYKLRGPFHYRHPYNPHCKVTDIKKTFALAITDPLPKEFSIDSRSIRELCLLRTDQRVENPFKTADGMSILFESVSRKTCYKYQEKFFKSLPLGARHPYSVIQSDSNTWQLIVVKGRTRKAQETLN